ncbi:MAG: hypothetical protein KGZ59_00830 [Chitinophagaceae bacterium]|nr:hypothetical protein [Chitinophagaceae bacterium]
MKKMILAFFILFMSLNSYALVSSQKFNTIQEFSSMKDFFLSWDTMMKYEQNEEIVEDYIRMKNLEMKNYLKNRYPEMEADALDVNDSELILFGVAVMLGEENEFHSIEELAESHSTIRCLIELAIGYIGLQDAFNGIIGIFSGQMTASTALGILKKFIRTHLGVIAGILFVAEFIENCL